MENAGLVNGKTQNMTHRVLGIGTAIGLVLAAISEYVSTSFTLLHFLYFSSASVGASLAVISAMQSDAVVKFRRCDNVADRQNSYYGFNARRFLACTGLASYLCMFTAKMADNAALIPAGIGMATAATINNAALGIPKHDETGYILFGLLGGATSAGLLINDMTKSPTAQDVLLAIANTVLLTMCVASVAINAKRHGVAISEAQGFRAKALAFLFGRKDEQSAAVGV